MHPLAYEHLKKVMEEKKLVGSDEMCEYYPCHFSGQDCTWCFCPFYPCEDERTGGEWMKKKEGGRIWDCSDCFWIHKSEVAKELLKEFKKFRIDSVEDIEKRKEVIKEVFSILISKYNHLIERAQ